MNFELFKMAVAALLANKTRTALSMLGVIIGVSTVIGVVGIGLGAEEQVQEQYKNLSANSLLIMERMGRDAIGSSKLDADDVDVILGAEMVTAAAAMVSGNADFAYDGESESTTVMGASPDIYEISNLDLAAGRFFTDEENDEHAKVAVIGNQVFVDFFPQKTAEEVVGQIATLNKKQFEVIGVLAENGSGMAMLSPDDSVYIPLQTAEKSLFGTNGRLMINAQVSDISLVDVAIIELTTLLRDAHKIREGREDDFSIRDAGSMVTAATDSAETLTALLTSVAAIVLLVSGIGIMNVMFVTVTERTREIGIIKAIGGQQKDILAQFLIEATVLSICGGIIGIGVGFGMIPLLNNLEDWYAIISAKGAVIGFGFSVLVGIFFGFYPALKASRLDPVDALRGE